MTSVLSPARAAVAGDRRQIAELIRVQEQVHRHLDWRNPLDWIGSPPYMVLETDAGVQAALACPPDPPKVAWLRLFVCSGALPTAQAWELLWNASCEKLAGQENLAAAILLQEWMLELLHSSGFHYRQDIVLLERDHADCPDQPLPPGMRLRPLMHYDLPAVAALDAAAFELLWQNSFASLRYAFSQAGWASVVESEAGILGYQISTRNPIGGHLARLAVRPEIQSRGLGFALAADWIRQVTSKGLTHLTVNTQSDNAASLALYHRLGFHETGVRYPVYVKELGSPHARS